MKVLAKLFLIFKRIFKRRRKGFEWSRKLSLKNRCGSCLFAQGGYEWTFRDGHKDYAYECVCWKIKKIQGKEYVWIDNSSCDPPIVFAHQRACEKYREASKFMLRCVLYGGKFKNYVDFLKEFRKYFEVGSPGDTDLVCEIIEQEGDTRG